MRATLAVLGVVSLATAALLVFVFVPDRARFPDDVDHTATYAGTLRTQFSTQALSRGELDELFVRDVPVTIVNHTETVAVDGDLALVATDGRALDPEGEVVRTSDGLYAIDRTTMLAVDSFPGTDVPDREPSLVVGFPVGTEARDYTGWSDEVGDTVDLRYERTEDHGGVETHVFSSSLTNRVVVDEDVLDLVPQTLSKDTIAVLAEMLDLPAALESQLEGLLPLLPEQVELGLVYSGQTTYWVEPTTGIVVDLERTESRAAYLDTAAIPIVVPVIDVWDWSYAATDEQVSTSVADAQDHARRLRLFGTFLPIGLLVLGVAAFAATIVLGRRGEQEVSGEEVAESSTPSATDVSTG